MSLDKRQDKLHGRDDLVARVTRSLAPLTLLTGDSGIGKSAVLLNAQASERHGLAPSPRTLPSSGGVLQRLLLDGLADALAEEVRRRGVVAEAGRRLKEAAERMARDRGQQLARALGRELLSIVRGRLGPDFGAALEEYAGALRESADESLAARLDNALDRTVVGLVVDLAREVCAFVSPAEIVLAFDSGERLPDPDVRVLADVVGDLPPGLRFRMAISDHTPEHRARVDFLLAADSGTVEIPVPGLTEAATGNWLQAERLPVELAKRVTRVTGGYPLHIGDLVAHLRAGGEVDSGPLHEVFARRTDEAWSQLDPTTAGHARRLCVLADPIPTDRTLQLLGIDAATWGETQERLSRARVFSVSVNGLPWFHEQRRRYLREIRLTPEERSATSVAAVNVLRDMVLEDEAVSRLGELADLAGHAQPLIDADDQLRDAVNLDRERLGLCAALVELIEPQAALPAVGADELLRYARQVFQVPGDLIGAFSHLGSCSFVHTAEGTGAAVAVPYWNDPRVALVICGRAEREFGRAPVPAAAGAVFRTEIQPRLEPFTQAAYGIGTASMTTLAEAAEGLCRPAGAFAAGGRGAVTALLMRGRYAGRPIYVHACFSDEGGRDAAERQLRGLTGEVFGEPLEVTDTLASPCVRVPARRFLLAVRRLLGSQVNLQPNGTKATHQLTSPLSPEDRLERRTACLRAVRARSSAVERYATGLDQPIGFVYSSDEQSFTVAEVIGGREEARRVDGLALNAGDPFRMFRLLELCGLQPNERFGVLKHHWGRGPDLSDPALELLSDLAGRGEAFNRYQRRQEVSLSEVELQRRLESALRLQLTDARTLGGSGAFNANVDEPMPLAYDVKVFRGPTDAAEGTFWSPRTCSVVIDDAAGPRDEVRVEVIDGPYGARRERPLERPRAIVGELTWVLCDLLGHRQDDLRIVDGAS
jgi:hypothetical protein